MACVRAIVTGVLGVDFLNAAGAENVAVPEELRSAAGVQELTKVLKDTFATARSKELYSIKLACRWSHPRTPYSDLLGYLTTLGDVEALSYQWQGHADKVHNADRMLRRVCWSPFLLTYPMLTAPYGVP